MRRGTTPTNTITTDIDLTGVEVIYWTYVQGKRKVLEFDIDRIEISPSSIVVKLTQDETLAFDEKKNVEMQVRARYPDGTAVSSDIMTTTVGRILKDGVI